MAAMQQRIAAYGRLAAAVLTAAALLAPGAAAADFETDLARITEALKTNPSRVLPAALDACMNRRAFAVERYYAGDEVRGTRSLRACFDLLEIPETPPAPKVVAPTRQDLEAKAVGEFTRAMQLKPDIANGLEIYRQCAACHMPEGFGLWNGSVPQIAGQHRRVIIKQLADMRAGHRDSVLMIPYASVESIGGAQALADVAAYIDTLEINSATGKGPGDDLELGERLYRENCATCHGPMGEGNDARAVPRIHGQHFNYLVRQFEWIRDGKRRNADPEMAAQIEHFGPRETQAVLDYVSRLTVPPDLVAPPGWKNPDFAQ